MTAIQIVSVKIDNVVRNSGGQLMYEGRVTFCLPGLGSRLTVDVPFAREPSLDAGVAAALNALEAFARKSAADAQQALAELGHSP